MFQRFPFGRDRNTVELNSNVDMCAYATFNNLCTSWSTDAWIVRLVTSFNALRKMCQISSVRMGHWGKKTRKGNSDGAFKRGVCTQMFVAGMYIPRTIKLTWISYNGGQLVFEYAYVVRNLVNPVPARREVPSSDLEPTPNDRWHICWTLIAVIL